MTLEPTPIRDPLDEFLREVVRAIHAAVTRGIATLKSDPPATDKALADCEEIVFTVMKGRVNEWVGADEPPAPSPR